MISMYHAAKVFRKHTKEILSELRETPKGYHVLAEVDADGNWRGAGLVTPGTISLLAHEKQGYAIHFYPEKDKTDLAISLAIEEWLEEMRNKAEKQERGGHND